MTVSILLQGVVGQEGLGGPPDGGFSPDTVLTRTSDVTDLTLDEASEGARVELELVVTGRQLDGFHGQGRTGAVFVNCPAGNVPLFRTKVRVFGRVVSGFYEPQVQAVRIVVIGGGAPRPISPRYSRLIAGHTDHRWVAVWGVVSRVQRGGSVAGAVVNLRLREGVIPVQCWLEDGGDPPTGLVGAEVMVRGAAAPLFNPDGQRVGTEIYADSLAAFEILKDPPPDLFGIPLTPVAAVAQYGSPTELARATRVRGTVFHRRGEEELIIGSDSGKALLVEVPGLGRQAEVLAPGEVIDVVGFPEPEGLFVRLKDASIRSSGEQRPLPAPKEISAAGLSGEATSLSHAFERVRIEGQVATVATFQDGTILDLVGGGGSIRARFPAGADIGVSLSRSRLREGTRVAVVGLNYIEATADRKLLDRYVLCNGSSDVEILATAPWWTVRKLSAALAIAIAAVAAVGIWNASLRRTVARQTGQIREQIAVNSAALERQRIARELHDTLSQGFAGVLFKLRTVAKALPGNVGEASRNLELARTMARYSLMETREALSDLRETDERSPEGWADDLEGLLKQIAAGSGIELTTDISGEYSALGIGQRLDWQRLATEAVSNAVNHGSPSRVKVTCRFPASGKGGARLVVMDDGQGFEPGAVAGSSSGHFGLQGMRERASRLGATIEIQSRPGAGTTVTVLAGEGLSDEPRGSLG